MCCDFDNDIAARSRSEYDDSLTKILSRRLDLRIKWKLNDEIIEANALQELLTKLKRKREVHDIKVLDKQMESGKISNALRCLSDDARGGVPTT